MTSILLYVFGLYVLINELADANSLFGIIRHISAAIHFDRIDNENENYRNINYRKQREANKIEHYMGR